ncbi:MAG TPA: EGF domain-containing protein [Polyangiaceae bacterium]|nr:EGF domain-containing protein [Polyangiaceae bacterium]
MKALWLSFAAFAILSCSSPQKGGDLGNTGGRPTKVTESPDGGGAGGASTKATTCGETRCDPNASCSESAGSPKCSCNAGYQGDGTKCTDIDECAAGTDDCDKDNGTCTNRSGGYDCGCKSEFIADGNKCVAAVKCGSDTDVCDPNATCSSGKAGVTCTCNDGFTDPKSDGKACADVNECASAKSFSCPANAGCVNTFGGYDCACNPGFSGDGNKACTALCDAAKADTSVCSSNGLCRVNGVAATCDACAAGYTGDGKTCTASTTCGADCDGVGTDAAHAVCASDGSCACAPGFAGTPGSCVDVDDCATNNGGCDAATMLCTNDTSGGHACTCKPGYALDKTGKCADVDECKQTTSPCHPDATCKNQAPDAKGVGYTCTCKSGFTGDGTVCTDVDECAAKDKGGCGANATCINTRGSSECQCTGGLVGDPKTGCYCDLSGVWATVQDVDTCWKDTPIQEGLDEILISAGNVESYVYSVSEFDYDGKSLTTKVKGCGSDKTPELSSPYFHETYSEYVPTAAFDNVDLQPAATWDVPGIVPGAIFTSPSDAAVVGIDLGADPLHATWPADHTAVTKWLDTDGDGEPGWTLWPRVPSQTTYSGSGKYSYLPAKPGSSGGSFYIDERAGCVSVALRVITHMEVTVNDCSHMTGKVINEKTEGRVHSCTRVPKGDCPDPVNTSCPGWKSDITCSADDWKSQTQCEDTDVDRLDNDQNQVQNSVATFDMKKIGKVGDTFSCGDVQSMNMGPKRTVSTINCTTPK